MESEFHPGDIVVLGDRRTREYLVLAVNRWGQPEAEALTGTVSGSQWSGYLPAGFKARKVGDLGPGTRFAGKSAHKLRRGAMFMVSRPVQGFPSADYWLEWLDPARLPGVEG
jgi:hypothetical protein